MHPWLLVLDGHHQLWLGTILELYGKKNLIGIYIYISYYEKKKWIYVLHLVRWIVMPISMFEGIKDPMDWRGQNNWVKKLNLFLASNCTDCWPWAFIGTLTDLPSRDCISKHFAVSSNSSSLISSKYPNNRKEKKKFRREILCILCIHIYLCI